MRLGITAFLTDRSIAPTELAVAVETRGLSSLYLPEHTHLPQRAAIPPSLVEGVDLEDYRRGLDPMVALATAAAVTKKIMLGTGVLLVAQHDPIVLAKQIATLDHLSGGRFVLGVGFGWNRAEAEDHGLDFGRRRAVARDHLACMIALWGPDPASYAGEFVTVPPCWARPKPVQQPRVRILVGGGPTDEVWDTVIGFADGWMPIGASGIVAGWDKMRGVAVERGRDPEELDVVPFGTIPDRGKLEHLREVGCDEVICRIPAKGRDDVLRDLDRVAALLEAVGT